MQPRTSLILIILLTLLGFRFFFFFQNQPQYHDGQKISLEVVLQEEPQVSAQGQKFGVKDNYNQKIFIRTAPFPAYHFGEKLIVSGVIQIVKLDRNREILTMAFPKIQVMSEGNGLMKMAQAIRQRSSLLYESTLPPISAKLLSGIVFGAKEDFPTGFKSDLQSAGVLHVIAASGMNVTFFTGAVMFSLGAFLKRRFALFLSIFAVIFYSALVGFEPSIIRSSIMALVAITASFFGRQNLALFALFLTGFSMLLWQPAFLFAVGFQLSFLATLGILVIKPLFGGLRKLGSWGEDIGTTLAAETATVPILLGTFGSFGVLSVVVNALVLWTVPLLMLLGSSAVLVGFVFEPLAKILLLLCLPFLLFFEKTVSFFGGLGWNFTVDTFPWEMGVGYYLILAGTVLFLGNRK